MKKERKRNKEVGKKEKRKKKTREIIIMHYSTDSTQRIHFYPFLFMHL